MYNSLNSYRRCAKIAAVSLFCIIGFFTAGQQAHAEIPTAGSRPFIVPIGGTTSYEDVSLGEYINTIYKYGVGVAALLAMGQIVLGGFLYTVSAGNVGSREGATERMQSAVTGLAILLGSALLLYTINPELLELNPTASTNDTRRGLGLLSDAPTPFNKLTENQIEARNARAGIRSNAAQGGLDLEPTVNAIDNKMRYAETHRRYLKDLTVAEMQPIIDGFLPLFQGYLSRRTADDQNLTADAKAYQNALVLLVSKQAYSYFTAEDIALFKTTLIAANGGTGLEVLNKFYQRSPFK